MKNPELTTHGTLTKEAADKIQEEGFKAIEGRATVSGDLMQAFAYATEKKKGSRNKLEKTNDDFGRIIIMRIPEDKTVDYATHTDIKVEEDSKEISGYTSKFESGRKQLAIYEGEDPIKRKKDIERIKQESNTLKSALTDYLRNNNIEPEKILAVKNPNEAKAALIEAIKDFDIDKKIEILLKTEEIYAQIIKKDREGKKISLIEPENILLNIEASPKLGEILAEIKAKLTNYEKLDFESLIDKISNLVQESEANFISVGVDIRDIVSKLLQSTVEAEIMSSIRSLSVNVKNAKGFTIYNRGKDEIKEMKMTREELSQKLDKIHNTVDSDQFNIGNPILNRYIKDNINRLFKELNG